MFDPYHKWLGIAPKDQPPNHYRLLGIDHFESDPEVVQEAAIRQTAHLRTYQTGAHAEVCSRLLEEIAQARVVLCDPALRQEYDAALRAQQPAAAMTPEPSSIFDTDESVGLPARQRARVRSIPWWVYLGIIFVPTVAVGAIAFVMMGNKEAKSPRDEHAVADHLAQESNRAPGHPAASAASAARKKSPASGDSDTTERRKAKKSETIDPSSGAAPSKSPFDNPGSAGSSKELPDPTPAAPAPGSAGPDNPAKMDPRPNPVVSEERQKQIQEWAKALKYGEEPRLIKACQEIGKAGPEARVLGRELCRTATDRSAKVRQAAVDALQTVRPDLHPYVVVLIARDVSKLKPTLAAISGLREQASDLIPIFVFDFKLAKMPKNNENYISDIAGPLARIGGNEEEIVRLLTTGYPSSRVPVREAVITALGIVAHDHKGMRRLVVPTLKTALLDPDLNTCLAAIRAAQECGAEASELLPTLRKAKLASAEAVRTTAARAIDAIESAKPEPKSGLTADQSPPDAEKLAASKLKQAQALLEDGKMVDARDFCQEILKKYPETKAAETAKDLLEKMAAKSAP